MAVYKLKHWTHSRIDVISFFFDLPFPESSSATSNESFSGSNSDNSINSPHSILLTSLLGTGGSPAPRIACEAFGSGDVCVKETAPLPLCVSPKLNKAMWPSSVPWR